ncbi:MAG TPA: hypoxanthine phosphoribosyltransferase [Acidimicrobiales bacterium]|nr:hypoxanthine phosphoribosyltransferase [Acidimicrobiales bacterium]
MIRVVVAPEALRAGVRRLAGEISAAYPAGVVLVAVLKGSVPFLADLARLVTVDVEIDFLAISSYAPDSGRVRIVKDLDIDIAGRDVVLVEDIVDTGLTLNYLIGQLLGRQPRSLSACTLLDRRRRRLLPTPLRFVGFPLDDDFALGYGLDYAGRYRNLDHIVAGDLATLRADADAYVGELFGG